MSGLRLLLAAVLLIGAGPVPGTISVEPASGDVSPEIARVFAEAVGGALAQRDFVPLPSPGRGRYTARLTVTREQRGLVATNEPRWAPSANLGSWGGSVQVRLPSRKTQLRALFATRLDVAIVPRDGGAPIWRGRAVTIQVEATRADSPQALAAKLADGVIGRFPEQAEEAAALP